MYEMVYPWEGPTCSLCRGPWGQNCVDGKKKCQKLHRELQSLLPAYSCRCCGAEVTQYGPMPLVGDDTAWLAILLEHSGSCEWATSRGYLIRTPHRLPLPV